MRPVERAVLGHIAPGTDWRALSPVQISGNAPAILDTLARQINAQGATANIVPRFTTGVRTAIIICTLNMDAIVDTHWHVFEQARAAQQAGCENIVFLQDTHSACHSGVSGLAKTAAREWPEMRIRYLACNLDYATISDAILRAVAHEDVEVEIDTGDRLTAPRLGASLAPLPQTHLPAPPVWLVTGGARGVTADCAIELARRTGGQFALLGRSHLSTWPEGIAPTRSINELRGALARQTVSNGEKPLPAEINAMALKALAGAEISETLAAIAAAGGVARYFPCDLMDKARCEQTLSQIHTAFGPVTGLVHGAGVLADRLIIEKTRDEFDRVLNTKITGLNNILSALDLSALTHIAFFSSAAARFGNIGQSDYAIANEILNHMAQEFARTLPHAQVKSFNWGPWAGGMVDDTLARHFEAQGIGLIPVETGAQIFADQLLSGAREQVELLIGDEWTA